MKLNIGAGQRQIEGYVSVDKYVDAELQADAWSIPLEDGTIEEIYCTHALEHLSFEEAKLALAEWHRLLSAGGKVTIVVPNIEWVAATALFGHDRGYWRQVMFGNQGHAGEFHRNGWKATDLQADLEEAGFEISGHVIVWTPEYSQESIIMEATKP